MNMEQEIRERRLVYWDRLRGDRAPGEPLPPLPDAGYVWWRAHIERRSIASERATRLITTVQRAAVLSAALLAVPLMRWAWPTLRSFLGAVTRTALQPASRAACRPG